MLIAGVSASLLCVVAIIAEICFGDKCWSPFCVSQWIAALVVLPTTIYFMRTIGNYDEQLRESVQRRRAQVEELVRSINKQVDDLNSICGDVTKTANHFAAGRFNDKGKAFKAFLLQVKERYGELYLQDEMLVELRRYVIAWFQAFAGTLINPRDTKLLQGLEAELNRCTSVQAVCTVAVKRLDTHKFTLGVQMTPATPTVQTRRALETALQARELCGVSWFRCGRCVGFRRERGESAMPVTLYLGCCKITLLSRSHANLLVAVLADVLLVFFELAVQHWASVVLVVVNVACVVGVLACYEQIDEISRLERETQQYQRRREEVNSRVDDARKTWEQVQRCHDLWKFRTMPSLDIMGKVHDRLRDLDFAMDRALAAGRTEADTRAEFLRRANDVVNALESQLGSLEDWRGATEPLAEGWKDSVGKRLLDCEVLDLDEILNELPAITNGS